MPDARANATVAPEPAAVWEQAAHLLDRAVPSSGGDPQVLYMLAMAYKRQGKLTETRNALRKITRPDADVLLQMALLSLREHNLVGAEEELTRAWEMSPSSFEIGYNLLLTRLTLGKFEEGLALAARVLQLAPAAERPFLRLLQALLQTSESDGSPTAQQALAEMTPADEQRLLRIIRSLGNLDHVLALLSTLAETRPDSVPAREAYAECLLVKGKQLADRCAWSEAEALLLPLTRERGLSRSSQVALLNLLGCCSCATQDFDAALRYYQAALKLSAHDPRLHQNIALAYELKGDMARADPHWNRFFDLLDQRVPAPPDMPDYVTTLAYEALGRLAGRYTEQEKWSNALSYVQRAHHLRPAHPETLERLFHLYAQAKRPQDARRTLEQLRRLRPAEPQYELYELDLIDVKGLNDIERLLTEIDRILQRYPNDARVEQRAVGMVGNVIPLMGNLCDQLTDQMTRVIEQVRSLPNYQINWSAVREVMRDLLRELQKLRRITGKCLPLVQTDEQRRIIRDLADHIDKKMEACRSMGA
jgi:tetratricopeptide (TPR) repeat protein